MGRPVMRDELPAEHAVRHVATVRKLKGTSNGARLDFSKGPTARPSNRNSQGPSSSPCLPSAGLERVFWLKVLEIESAFVPEANRAAWLGGKELAGNAVVEAP